MKNVFNKMYFISAQQFLLLGVKKRTFWPLYSLPQTAFKCVFHFRLTSPILFGIVKHSLFSVSLQRKFQQQNIVVKICIQLFIAIHPKFISLDNKQVNFVKLVYPSMK